MEASRRYVFVVFILSWIFLPISAAQTGYSIEIRLDSADFSVFKKEISDFQPRPVGYPPVIQTADSAAAVTVLIELRDFFHKRGYITASLDSIDTSSRTRLVLQLYIGPLWTNLALRPADAISVEWLEAVAFRPRQWAHKPIDTHAFLQLEKKLLERLENSGHPFANIRLDSLEVGQNGLSGALRVTPGPYITLSGIQVTGDLRLPRAYLPNYLGIRVGQPYSRERILRIKRQLQSLLFAEVTANPTIRFTEKEAAVQLYLKKKRAGRFDFIVGLLPQTGSSNRLLVTGSLNAAFQNALNMGERFSLEFERLRPETQKLDVNANLPYLFGAPFGVEGRLNIFRRDSSWVDAQSRFGVQYWLEGGDVIGFFWENRSVSLQSIDTIQIINTRRLPAALDLRQNSYGLEGSIQRLDYRFNPRSGWALNARMSAGFSRVLPNNRIEDLRDPDEPEFDFARLYDTLTARATRYRLESWAEFFIPLAVRTTLKLGVRGGGIWSDKPIYINEQYRLGGNKLLRGFNEESILASRYGIATLELRLLLSQNSYLAAFTDYGYIDNRTNRTNVQLQPWGFGAGLTFETNAGIFGISLAVGRPDSGQSVDLRAAKFHLGYVSLF